MWTQPSPLKHPCSPRDSRRAVRAAQLLPDLRVWKGDAHPVGARGTTLSGGQRARLGLSRSEIGKRVVHQQLPIFSLATYQRWRGFCAFLWITNAILGAQFLAGWAWRRSCTASWRRSRLYTVEMQIVLAGVWRVATRIIEEKRQFKTDSVLFFFFSWLWRRRRSRSRSASSSSGRSGSTRSRKDYSAATHVKQHKLERYQQISGRWRSHSSFTFLGIQYLKHPLFDLQLLAYLEALEVAWWPKWS